MDVKLKVRVSVWPLPAYGGYSMWIFSRLLAVSSSTLREMSILGALISGDNVSFDPQTLSINEEIYDPNSNINITVVENVVGCLAQLVFCGGCHFRSIGPIETNWCLVGISRMLHWTIQGKRRHNSHNYWNYSYFWYKSLFSDCSRHDDEVSRSSSTPSASSTSSTSSASNTSSNTSSNSGSKSSRPAGGLLELCGRLQ